MIDVSHLPYRPNVGIVLVNTAGLVFIGNRSKTNEELRTEEAWQMPQGGIDQGEEPLTAAYRELFEETNVRSVTLLAECPEWLSYDLPQEALKRSWKSKYRGQTQRWFAFRFEGDESEIDILSPGGGAHKPEFSHWKWERLERLPDLIVPFKRPVYEKVVEAFRGVVG